jgi:SAM-dependent methyltransferase
MEEGQNRQQLAPPPANTSGHSLAMLARRLRDKVGQLGWLGTLGLIPKNARRLVQIYVDERFDRRYGVKTAGYTALHELVIDSPHKGLGIRYQPTTHKRLVAMFANLPRDLGDFTFVDFGSGRGRVLLFASEFGFKQVIGVEFSAELHRSALDNMARAKHVRKCKVVQPVHADATKYTLPDGPLVLYFFDPFRDEVMQQVLLNIKRSYQSNPRKMYLMYLAPVHEAMVMETGVFRPVPVPPLPHEFSLPAQYRFAFFETGPDA